VIGWRKKPSAVADFWQWWAEARTRVAAGIADGGVARLAGEIGDRVSAIEAGLEWELAPGRTAKHALIVTGAGNGKLRGFVARWLESAPPADETWEYHGARQPDPSVSTAKLEFNGHQLNLGELRFAASVNDDHAYLDVRVFHPAFGQLGDDDRMRVSFMSLNWLLGEDRVENWVGPIEPALIRPADAVDAASLIRTADALAADHLEPRWVVMSGTADGAPMMAVAQRPLRPFRWPRFDTHVAVRMSYPDRGNGLPTDGSLDQMRAAEDDLTALVEGNGELVAHETTGGVRVLHFYVDATTNAAAVLAKRARQLRATTTDAYDPELEQVEHLS
jgi:hypothetical protein